MLAVLLFWQAPSVGSYTCLTTPWVVQYMLRLPTSANLFVIKKGNNWDSTLNVTDVGRPAQQLSSSDSKLSHPSPAGGNITHH